MTTVMLRICPRCQLRPIQKGAASYCGPCFSEYRQTRRSEPITGITLTCRTCGVVDDAETFPIDRHRSTGRSSQCFDCRKSQNLNTNLKHETGGAFDEALFFAALERQMGLCAICGSEQTPGKRLCADHSHKTGKPRGLLCDRCNWAIGLFDENIARLGSAIQYVAAWK